MTKRTIDTTYKIERTTVPPMDEILGLAFPILDEGFIRVIDYMGDDLSIEEAARLSYSGGGTRKVSETQGLINYLLSHRHNTPFEMCELKLHVKMPIFVMRQWVRHRMASINEVSARYSVLPEEFYLPELEDLQTQSKTNKQGRGDNLVPHPAGTLKALEEHSETSYRFYQALLSEDVDLTRELARMGLPVNFYTEIFWKIDLHNLLNFLSLRNDSHAQKEIRVYAEQIEEFVAMWVPLTHAAYVKYRKNSITFSGEEIKVLRLALSMVDKLDPSIVPQYPHVEFSKREWGQFVDKIRKIA